MCDEPKYDIDRMSQNVPLMKNTIMAKVISDDYLMSELRRACKEAGVGIAIIWAKTQVKQLSYWYLSRI